MIQIQNLSFGYDPHRMVLHSLSLEMGKGEKWGIMGPMGAGKTSLLLALAGLVEFQGTLKMDGLTWNKEGQEELRQKVGILFQNPDDQLFMPTVEEDIGFGLIQMGLAPEVIQQKIEHILDYFSLGGLENRPSHHLSGGEKKLVSLAAVLVMEPEILLLDEPSANLDPYHRRKMIQEIQKLEKTIVVASHDLDLLWEVTHKVALLDQGRLIVQGDTQEILQNRELLESHKMELPLFLQNPKA